MRSRVAEQLSAELTADVLRMTIDQRIDLAFRLGDEAVADYASANGVDEAMAHKC